MKRVLPFITLLLLAASCGKQGPVLEIRGQISADFDGQKIYFCPQPEPTADIVDSTVVKEGTFFFRIPADSLYMADLTVSRRAPGYAERLLIAVEPGILEVSLGARSSARGTPLNDDLQVWKEQLQEASSPESACTQTFDLIRRHPNAVGGYLYLLFKNRLDEDQRQTLDALGYDKLLPDVTTRKQNR